jgi:hypothetical protein
MVKLYTRIGDKLAAGNVLFQMMVHIPLARMAMSTGAVRPCNSRETWCRGQLVNPFSSCLQSNWVLYSARCGYRHWPKG